jgi:hypothetical protein
MHQRSGPGGFKIYSQTQTEIANEIVWNLRTQQEAIGNRLDEAWNAHEKDE